MNAEQPPKPDKRTAAVENSGYKWAFHVLFFGLFLDCLYRYKLLHESIWDLVALAGLSVAVIAAHLIAHKPAEVLWSKLFFAHIVPGISLADLPVLLISTLAGVLAAGCYGVMHDLITFSIGPEYFRNFKFQLFPFADFGWGELAFVSLIGFLGTWWVGLIGGWMLARRAISSCPKRNRYRRIGAGFLIVFAAAASAGILGCLYGLWRGPDADYSAWEPVLEQHHVTDAWPFICVAYIHNAGYIGALVGLVSAYFAVRPGALDEKKSEAD
jgi:hypothetical protein